MLKRMIALFLTISTMLLCGCANTTPNAGQEASGSSAEKATSEDADGNDSINLVKPDSIKISPCICNAETGESLKLGPLSDGNSEKPLSSNKETEFFYDENQLVLTTKSNELLSIYFTDDSERWSLFNGIKIGSSKSDVAKLFGIENVKDISSDFSTYLDSEMNKIGYSNDAFCSLSISFSENIVSGIFLKYLENIPILQADGVIEVYSVSTSDPNSAGGVDANISFSNISDKTIKYAYFSVTPYNAVGDPVSSEVGNQSTIQLKVTGPIEPDGEVHKLTSSCAWYNSDIVSAKLESAEIEYMDGTAVNLGVQQ